MKDVHSSSEESHRKQSRMSASGDAEAASSRGKEVEEAALKKRSRKSSSDEREAPDSQYSLLKSHHPLEPSSTEDSTKSEHPGECKHICKEDQEGLKPEPNHSHKESDKLDATPLDPVGCVSGVGSLTVSVPQPREETGLYSPSSLSPAADDEPQHPKSNTEENAKLGATERNSSAEKGPVDTQLSVSEVEVTSMSAASSVDKHPLSSDSHHQER